MVSTGSESRKTLKQMLQKALGLYILYNGVT